MSAYMWSLLHNTSNTDFDPDPPDPDDPDPDPVDPDDDEPDPVDPDDDEPDPPDPEESYCAVSLTDRTAGQCSAWGYVRVDLRAELKAFEQQQGSWSSLWSNDREQAMSMIMNHLTVKVGVVDDPTFFVRAEDLPLGAQWAAVGWARHRPYYVLA